jgi:nicotinate-nucleotide--dimethylbenzimidazole phosphoribosyltransferase
MTIEELKKRGSGLKPVSSRAYEAVMKHWDSIAKPVDGLGIFERMIARIGSIQDTEKVTVKNRSLIVFLSDNGIVSEGVSQSGQEVTCKVARAMADNRSTVCMMAEQAKVTVYPVDVGMCGEKIAGIKDLRVRSGSRNFAKEPAMTLEETLDAMDAGYREAVKLHEEGTDILLLGEMGIGNTSTSTALSCVLLGISPDEVTGYGAGLSDEMIRHKSRVISKAVNRYNLSCDDIPGILSTFGGYDIAAMVGAILAGAECRMPVIADGLITLSAVLTAQKLFPGVRDYCIASHVPKEPMGRRILKELDLEAPIAADMALGEGTGAVLLMPLLDVCMNLYDNGIRFDGLNMDAYKRYDR